MPTQQWQPFAGLGGPLHTRQAHYPLGGATVSEYSEEQKASLQLSVLGVLFASIGFWIIIWVAVAHLI